MNLIKQFVQHEWSTPNALQNIEYAGRTCYKSENKVTNDSAEKFIKMVLKRGHESVIEHASASFRIVTDRGVTHEIVRHRLSSYSQESTRYCNYKNGVSFILPVWVDIPEGEYHIGKQGLLEPFNKIINITDSATLRWLKSIADAEASYLRLLDLDWKPEQARAVLPNSLKTEIVMTANFREWRHFLKLRTNENAHPQMREIAFMIKDWFIENYPIMVEEI